MVSTSRALRSVMRVASWATLWAASAISCTDAPCSWALAATFWDRSPRAVTCSRMAPMVREDTELRSVSRSTCSPMTRTSPGGVLHPPRPGAGGCPPMDPAALRLSSARVRTSSATTAKPRPASPARAASMAAFRGQQVRLVRDLRDDPNHLMDPRGLPGEVLGQGAHLGPSGHGGPPGIPPPPSRDPRPSSACSAMAPGGAVQVLRHAGQGLPRGGELLDARGLFLHGSGDALDSPSCPSRRAPSMASKEAPKARSSRSTWEAWKAPSRKAPVALRQGAPKVLQEPVEGPRRPAQLVPGDLRDPPVQVPPRPGPDPPWRPRRAPTEATTVRP